MRGAICSLYEISLLVPLFSLTSIRRDGWWNLRSTPNPLPAFHCTARPLLTAAWISFSAPLALLLSTNTTTAALPLRRTSLAHSAGSALSSSSTTPSATTSASFRLRFLPRCPASISSSPRFSCFQRLCSGRAGTEASKSTLSTRAPPSCSANRARMLDSEASIGTFATNRLRSAVAVYALGSWGLMYR